MLKPTIWKLRGVKWTKNLVNHCGPERADQELGKGGRETLGRTYGRRPWRPRRLRLHAGICLPPPRTSVSITCLPRPAVAFSMGASGGFRDKREALGGPEALLFTPPAAGRALSGCAHERLLVQLPLQAPWAGLRPWPSSLSYSGGPPPPAGRWICKGGKGCLASGR